MKPFRDGLRCDQRGSEGEGATLVKHFVQSHIEVQEIVRCTDGEVVADDSEGDQERVLGSLNGKGSGLLLNRME